MATLYVDLENGNDNYGGTSFAVLAQGTNGRISSTTFSSATANFPNDGSLIGQYLSIFDGSIYAVYNITAWVSSTSLTIAAISGGTALANQTVDRQYFIGGRWKSLTNGATAVRIAPGDTVRIMGSPAPTSLGQTAVWTSQALQGTQGISASTNTTPIEITSLAANHGRSTGDTVVITGHTINTNANGTWEITVTAANKFTLDGSSGNGVGGATGSFRLRNNTRVMLTTPVTQNIASTGPGRAAWVAVGANILTTASSTNKEHANADVISVLAAFTTGKAAYYTLPTTLNLSDYQQVSFWLFSGVGLSSGQIEIRLCSDTAGDTAVNTISVPSVPAANRYQAVTVDTASNLGSSIASIALYINTDLSTTSTHNLVLNNIIACKASSDPDSLTLTSLIGKNTTGETFWGIQSINGRRVMLDADTNATPTSNTVRGYYGTSETVTTWKRETIKLGPAASSPTALQTIQDSGTDGNPITFSGGWDRTNMSTQNLETWLDGANGNGRAITDGGSDRNNLSYEKLAFARFDTGFVYTFASPRRNSLSIVAANNCSSNGLNVPGSVGVHSIDATVANALIGTVFANTIFASKANIGISNSNGSHGIQYGGTGSLVSCKSYNNGGAGIDVGLPLNFSMANSILGDNGSVSIRSVGANGVTHMKDCLLSNSTELEWAAVEANGIVFSHNHDQASGNHKIFMFGSLISAATDQRHTASGISWKIQPTSTNRSSAWPVVLSLAKVACAANSLVTIKAWMRRDNSGLTMRLVCKGGQIAGVANDVVSALTTTNAWEEETITFTPTETGVVEITAEAWGGTTFSGWVDDMTISQA